MKKKVIYISGAAAAIAYNVFSRRDAHGESVLDRARLALISDSSPERFIEAERRVLSHFSDNPVTNSVLIPIGQGESIATVRLPANDANDGEASRSPIVLCCGYGATVGHWARCLPDLGSRTPKRDVFAFDWLGTGRSSRPLWDWLPWRRLRAPFAFGTDSSTAKLRLPWPSLRERAELAEDFFVDSLERWRAAVGAERMVLVAHSFGGIMASAYALKYPHR